MEEAIIKLNEITKRYDDHYAVDHLSLSIRKGEIFGLLGPNGAGKTTSILMMLGLSEPTSGTVQVAGIDSTKYPIEVKRKVGYLPDNVGFYPDMTGMENLLYTASLNGIQKIEAIERANTLLEKVGLTEAAKKKTGQYSRGMKQRLGLADVLMKGPEIIILDEPTLGIDPEGVRDFLHLIRNLNQNENLTVLLCSHHLHQVQQVCDRVGIFVDGKLLAYGDLDQLVKRLFKHESVVIHVAASPIDESLLNQLKTIEQVKNVDVIQEDRLDIYCREDASATISKLIVESGSNLYHLYKKHFGLDEIYHRYFEGREANEAG
ncbi:ABC transporter ATP-binding protein [Halalkalibacterium halodurans]|uniref:ABC transporter (ATP-binding protein) n=2 Tax=Halalkalibacterium halodurans TaxID=86665 RepID=Q9K7Z3_HALH5|nr:ABC transporter ATP-binding protein [Halalkalibacterium halodurans]MED3647184.1 ABC transporter ATP-binding protein [Halalkalibacterium halodurans]MED4081152.1 ABC transporter ATP-binding protein [Halalkalibacterium halodurans]MED4084395.1 ABC transporter ATP-binding protein [Halalkalibacterium halodurans]MED4103536.1 ABC transporter ATP-binding protein [Halalkalibacterium halodurans]MED4108801.1 ABC transporter ATP-binding protein [Halalkalibacterium halodurans]